MKKNAFTMIELVFIIVILGVLAAIAVPKMMANREDVLFVGYKTDLEIIDSAIKTYFIANGAPPKTLADLPLELNQERWSMDKTKPLKDQSMFRTHQVDVGGARVTCVEIELKDDSYVLGFPEAGRSTLCDRVHAVYAKSGLKQNIWNNRRYFVFHYNTIFTNVNF